MSRYYLIYDDACPICLASLDAVRRIDTLGIVVPVPLSNPAVAQGVALPAPAELRNALHLIDERGNIYRGADAVAAVLSLFPKSRWLGAVLRLPGIRQIARGVYGIVARNRLRVSRIVRPAR